MGSDRTVMYTVHRLHATDAYWRYHIYQCQRMSDRRAIWLSEIWNPIYYTVQLGHLRIVEKTAPADGDKKDTLEIILTGMIPS